MSNSVQPHRQQPTRLPHPWDSPGKNSGVGCYFLLQCMKVKTESEVIQSCLTLHDPMAVAYQAPPSMGFSRKEYWSGLPCPSPNTPKSLLQHYSSTASSLQHSAFFIVQLSHPYMTTGKTIALTRWTFLGKVMSLLLNMLSRLVIAFLPRSPS